MNLAISQPTRGLSADGYTVKSLLSINMSRRSVAFCRCGILNALLTNAFLLLYFETAIFSYAFLINSKPCQ